MQDRQDREHSLLQKLLTAQARVWGKLSLVQNNLTRLEEDLAAAHARLREADSSLARLERRSFARLKATLRGRLPSLLEDRSRQAAAALADVETLEIRLEEARGQRDRLERHLSRLRSKEASFSEQALERVRRPLDESDSELDPADLSAGQVLQIGHDLEDLEEADACLAEASRALEEARDALGAIEPPDLLSLLTGLAILDLFETDEIKQARKAFRHAKDAGRQAVHALRSLEMLSCPATCLEVLEELEAHWFLEKLYEGTHVVRVFEEARGAAEDFRSRIWNTRTRIHSLNDGLLAHLAELEGAAPAPPEAPPG